MAKSSSMRLGSLNLLVMVIALSLAVLGVLELVSASASQSLTNRQAEAVSTGYAQESAAQKLLSNIDGYLSYERRGGVIRSSVMDALAHEMPAYVDDVESLDASAEYGLSVEASVFDANEFRDFVKLTCASRVQSASECIGGVSYQIVSESGRCLDCLIGITAEGKYDIYYWKTSKIWVENDTEDKLWTGNR